MTEDLWEEIIREEASHFSFNVKPAIKLIVRDFGLKDDRDNYCVRSLASVPLRYLNLKIVQLIPPSVPVGE
eukprot:12893444-Prorocentrum_lima.AAC.1